MNADAVVDAADSSAQVEGNVLGFDVGTRRIGVALGSALMLRARAVAVLDVTAAGPDWAQLDRLLREWAPTCLVVGDPMTLDGGDQPIRKTAHAFARTLKQRTQLKVLLVDERSSSRDAAHRFASARAEGRQRRRDADKLDAVAAAIILERWLASPGDATVVI